MLNKDILNALAGYTADMTSDVTVVLQTGAHPKRAELIGFLENFTSVSDKLHFKQIDLEGALRDGLSFRLEVDGAPAGIAFSGIPGGHEFNSLVLAVLQAGGADLKLDDSITDIIAGIDRKLDFEVFVSLSCHNCPDIVQALNKFALLNPNISVETIDGGLYPDLIEARNIQGVPAVWLNGEVFANGKIDTAELVKKLMAKYPDSNAAPKQGKESLPVQDMVIIGGGPAGAAAAIYGARKGLKVTMVAETVGGQLKDTMAIENMISVPKTTGPELSGALAAHMGEYDITLKEHFQVERIEQGSPKKIYIASGEVIEAKSVIITTGARWRELGVPGEKENIGNGVAYCPHCDGPFFKGRDVAVIGGGNSGIEAALDLAGIVKSVTVLEFMPELKADKLLVDQAQSRDNIRIVTNAAAERITATNGKVSGIDYQCRDSGKSKSVSLDGVFVQIGLVPNSGFAEGLVDLNRYGEIIIDEKCATSAEGIFAAGDVTTVPYKQIVIGMGEGAKAALAAFDYLIRQR